VLKNKNAVLLGSRCDEFLCDNVGYCFPYFPEEEEVEEERPPTDRRRSTIRERMKSRLAKAKVSFTYCRVLMLCFMGHFINVKCCIFISF